jgi:hypothetical protein
LVAKLEKGIVARFAGHEASVGEIEDFVLAETAYRGTHYTGQVLKELEAANPPRPNALCEGAAVRHWPAVAIAKIIKSRVSRIRVITTFLIEADEGRVATRGTRAVLSYEPTRWPSADHDIA